MDTDNTVFICVHLWLGFFALERAAKERGERNATAVGSYA